MTSAAGEVTRDGAVRNREDACDLAQARALDGMCGDWNERGSALEPIGGGEGLGGKLAPTVRAAEALDADAIGGSGEKAILVRAPLGIWLTEGAFGIGAKGWPELAAQRVWESVDRVHALGSS